MVSPPSNWHLNPGAITNDVTWLTVVVRLDLSPGQRSLVSTVSERERERGREREREREGEGEGERKRATIKQESENTTYFCIFLSYFLCVL